MAALRGGAGLVTVFSPAGAILVNAAHLTAVMLQRCEDEAELRAHLEDERLNAFMLGPDFSATDLARTFAKTLLSAGRRLVLGADAITAFQEEPEALFAAALEACFDAVVQALEEGADAAHSVDPTELLDAMGGAYAALIRDRTLLMLQVHAQSVADIPEIGDALRAGLARVTQFARERSAGTDDDVQRFMAYGQLCPLLVTARLAESPASWAQLPSHGIRHPD